MSAESIAHRYRLPPVRPAFLFLREQGLVVTPWPRSPEPIPASREARSAPAGLTDQQLAELEAVRARLVAACQADRLPAVAWISEAGLTPVHPEPSWLARKLHDCLSVAAALPG